jgi:hypothetical protein
MAFHPTEGIPRMLDFIYVASTIVFFALMLAFVHALDWLGQDCGADGQEPS